MQAHVQAAVASDIHFARSLSDMGYGKSSVPMTCTSRFLAADNDDDGESNSKRLDEEAEAAANRENPTRTAIAFSKPVFDVSRGAFCTIVRFSREMPFLTDIARALGVPSGSLSPVRQPGGGGGAAAGGPGSGGGGGSAAGGGGGVVPISSGVLGRLHGSAGGAPVGAHAAAAAAAAAQAPLLVGVACFEAAFGPRYPLEPCQWRLLSPSESQPFMTSADPNANQDGKDVAGGGGGAGGGEGDGVGAGFTVSLGITADAVSEYVTTSANSFSSTGAKPTGSGGAGDGLDGAPEGGETREMELSSAASEPPGVPEREYLHVLLHPCVSGKLLGWLPQLARGPATTHNGEPTPVDRDGEPQEPTWPTSFLRDFVALVRGWVSLEVDDGSLLLAGAPSASDAGEHGGGGGLADMERYSRMVSPMPEHLCNCHYVGPGVNAAGVVLTLPVVSGDAATTGAATGTAFDTTAAAAPTLAIPAVTTHAQDAPTAAATTLLADSPFHLSHTNNSSSNLALSPVNVSPSGPTAMDGAADAHARRVHAREQAKHRRRRFAALMLPQGGLVAWGSTGRQQRSARAASLSSAAVTTSSTIYSQSPGDAQHGEEQAGQKQQQQQQQEQQRIPVMGLDAPQRMPPPRLAYPPWVFDFYVQAMQPLPWCVATSATGHESANAQVTAAATCSVCSGACPPTPTSFPQQQQQQQQSPPTPSSSTQGMWPDWFTGVDSAHTGSLLGRPNGDNSSNNINGLEESPVLAPRTAKILLTSRFYTDGGLLPTMLREPAFVFGTHRRSCRWVDVNLTLEGEAHLALHAAAKLCKALHLDAVAHLLSTLRRLAKAVSTTYHSLNVSLSRKHKGKNGGGGELAGASALDTRNRDGEALNSYVHEMIGPVLRETVRVLQASHQPFWAGVAVCCLTLPCLLRDGSRSDRDGASSAAAYTHAFGPATAGPVEDTDVLAPFLHHAGIFGDYVSVVGLVERVLALVGQDTKRCEARIVRRALERALYAKVRPLSTATAASADASVDLYLRLQRLKTSYPHPMTARHAPINACAVCGLSLLDRSLSTGIGELAMLNKDATASPDAAVVVGVRSGTKHGGESAPEGCLVLQCVQCGHGGHVEHLMAWWADPDVRGCPKGCDCECVY